MQNRNNERLNEQVLNMLEQLENIANKKGDIIRARSYRKAIETIEVIIENITDVNDFGKYPNIGKSMINKMKEYIKLGTIDEIVAAKNDPLMWLTDIHGIGPKKAEVLVSKGISNINELRERKDELLNNSQKIGLKYFDDISQRIPREEIDRYIDLFDSIIESINTEIIYDITGSYRRGALYSGDIDILITAYDGTYAYTNFIDALIEQGIMIEVLSKGNTKCMAIVKLNDYSIARRIDILFTPPKEYYYALLYFTGSKAFNTTMRDYALKLGLTLNEHGLYEDKTNPIDHIMESEEDIFDYLYLNYKAPKERKDGRDIETTIIYTEQVANYNFIPVWHDGELYCSMATNHTNQYIPRVKKTVEQPVEQPVVQFIPLNKTKKIKKTYK